MQRASRTVPEPTGRGGGEGRGFVVGTEAREEILFCSLCGSLLEFCSFRASKRVQQGRVLAAASPDGLSLSLRTHVVEGEN